MNLQRREQLCLKLKLKLKLRKEQVRRHGYNLEKAECGYKANTTHETTKMSRFQNPLELTTTHSLTLHFFRTVIRKHVF